MAQAIDSYITSRFPNFSNKALADGAAAPACIPYTAPSSGPFDQCMGAVAHTSLSPKRTHQ